MEVLNDEEVSKFVDGTSIISKMPHMEEEIENNLVFVNQYEAAIAEKMNYRAKISVIPDLEGFSMKMINYLSYQILSESNPKLYQYVPESYVLPKTQDQFLESKTHEEEGVQWIFKSDDDLEEEFKLYTKEQAKSL